MRATYICALALALLAVCPMVIADAHAWVRPGEEDFWDNIDAVNNRRCTGCVLPWRSNGGLTVQNIISITVGPVCTTSILRAVGEDGLISYICQWGCNGSDVNGVYLMDRPPESGGQCRCQSACMQP